MNDTLPYIQQQLIRYVDSFYLIFGISGCCLNILLLSRRQFQTASCCTYLLAMNITMVVHLSFGMGMYLYTLDHVDPITISLAACKIRVYLLQSTAMIYRWCLTAACFDRFTLSSINVRLRNFAQVYIARRVISGIIISWIILPIHILIFYNIKGNICGIVYNIIAAFYHSIFTTVTGGILPVTIMTVCAVLIHRNLINKEQRRQQLNTNQDSSIRSQRKRDQQVLFMLLIQVLVYAILMTPLMCWYFYSAITLNIPNKTSDRVAIERFAMFTAELIIFGFPVSSFYLYTISSSIFRTELKIMIRKIFNHTNRIMPTTISCST